MSSARHCSAESGTSPRACVMEKTSDMARTRASLEGLRIIARAVFA
jgi:hypothetical protein